MKRVVINIRASKTISGLVKVSVTSPAGLMKFFLNVKPCENRSHDEDHYEKIITLRLAMMMMMLLMMIMIIMIMIMIIILRLMIIITPMIITIIMKMVIMV